jgi:quinol monooxygenase YgiN
MLIVHVNVLVKPECLDAFAAATLKNAAASLLEPGIARFDVIRNAQVTNHFVLIEVYRNERAPAEHKATPHYAEWRDAVANMMQEPRTSVRFENLFPSDQGWNMPAGG